MMKNLSVLLCTGSLLLAGCASPPERFYVLSALQTAQSAEQGAELAVGVGPVEMPDYLDRPQIVTRTGLNELNLAEYDRWGEPIKDNATEVLAENLAILLSSKKVSVYPWRRSTVVNYQIPLKIIRFDRTEGGEVVLHVRWSLLDGDGKELFAQESRFVESPKGVDFPATVAAMDRALGEFSREVANTLRGLQH